MPQRKTRAKSKRMGGSLKTKLKTAGAVAATMGTLALGALLASKYLGNTSPPLSDVAEPFINQQNLGWPMGTYGRGKPRIRIPRVPHPVYVRR